MKIPRAWKLLALSVLLLGGACGPKVEPPPPEPPEEAEVITTPERLALAGELMERGRVGEAAEHYVEVLKEEPDDFEANLNLGIALWTMEDAGFQNERDFEKARTHLRKAAALRANDPRPHLYLGRIDFDRKAYGTAVSHLSTAASLDPGDEVAHEMLGIALIEVGSREDGMRELKSALQINPWNEAANMALGKIYESEDRNGLAREHLERALAANPNLDMATYLLQRVYYEEGLHEMAEAKCMHFLKYHPEDIQSLEILGWIYKIQGRTAEMVDVYSKLTRIAPDNTTYWSPVIQHYMETEDYGQAKQILERALETNPYYAYGNVRYGQVLMHFAEEAGKSGKKEEAIRFLSLARDHLERAAVDDRYSDAASRLKTQVENRLRNLSAP